MTEGMRWDGTDQVHSPEVFGDASRRPWGSQERSRDAPKACQDAPKAFRDRSDAPEISRETPVTSREVLPVLPRPSLGRVFD